MKICPQTSLKSTALSYFTLSKPLPVLMWKTIPLFADGYFCEEEMLFRLWLHVSTDDFQQRSDTLAKHVIKSVSIEGKNNITSLLRFNGGPSVH